jgi:raffinose/stachyose/melibiose transport system permease protein
MGLSRYGPKVLLRELTLVLVAVVFCLPFYVLVTMSLQTREQTFQDPLSLPRPPHVSNYSDAWTTGGEAGLGTAMKSSLIITVSSVAALIVLGSLCAYTLARRRDRLSDAVYVLFVIGIILPFQLAIIPLYIGMHDVGLTGTYLGMIVLNIGFLMPLTVFLYAGFIRALPRDYEEAARVDGAGILRTYASVVFPLLWPVTATVAVLLGIVVWNEFFIALVFLLRSRAQTLPVAISYYVGDDTEWNLVFAGIAIALAPILAFYLFAQRYLIRGFSAGVKG